MDNCSCLSFGLSCRAQSGREREGTWGCRACGPTLGGKSLTVNPSSTNHKLRYAGPSDCIHIPAYDSCLPICYMYKLFCTWRAGQTHLFRSGYPPNCENNVDYGMWWAVFAVAEPSTWVKCGLTNRLTNERFVSLGACAHRCRRACKLGLFNLGYVLHVQFIVCCSHRTQCNCALHIPPLPPHFLNWRSLFFSTLPSDKVWPIWSRRKVPDCQPLKYQP